MHSLKLFKTYTIQAGRPIANPRSRVYASVNSRIIQIVSEINQRPPLEYLTALSHNISLPQ